MAFKIAEAYVEVTTKDNTAAGEAKIKTRLDRIRGTAKVDVDVNTGSLLRAKSEVTAFGNSMSQHGNRTLAIFAAITAAAPLVAGAIAAIPAATASLGGIAGVLVGSFHGVSDALKGYAQDQEDAGKASTRSAKTEMSNARAIRDAQQSIADARRNQARVAEDSAERVQEAQQNEARVARDTAEAIASAQKDQADAARQGADKLSSASRQVEDALQREEDAQKALTQAQKDAQRQIESLTERVHDLALDQEGAAISVAEAQIRYDAIMADATTTDLDRRKAAYDLATAQERVRDLTREQTEATSDLTDANAKGVNGSDQVVAAQRQVEDAHQGVIDAQKNLVDTQREVAQANEEAAQRVAKAVRDGAEAQADAAKRTAKAQEDSAQAQEDAARGVAEATQHLADVQADQAAAAAEAAVKTSAYAEAMAKLSPQQRLLVEQLLRMKPLLKDLGDSGSRGFLPGLVSMLKDSEGLFPIFNAGLERTGNIMGDSARKAGELFQSPEFKKNLDALFRASDPITKALGDGFVSLSNTVVRAGADLAPVSEAFARFLDAVFRGLDKFFAALADHKEDFAKFLDIAGRLMEQLLPAIADVAGVLAHVLGPALEVVVGWMEKGDGRASALILTFISLYATIKAVNLVKDVARWVDGVIGLLDKVGISADINKGKVSGLSGSLKTLGVLAGAYVAGQGLKAVGAPGPTDKPFDQWSTSEKLKDASDSAGDLLTGNVSGIFDRLKRDINSFPDDLARAGTRIDGVMNDIFGSGLTGAAQNFSDWLDGLLGVNNKTNDDILDNTTSHMGKMVDVSDHGGHSIFDTVSGWFGRLPGNASDWFGSMRDKAGERLGDLRDSASQTTSDTWTRISGWFGRLGGDAYNWFESLRSGAWGKLNDLLGGASDLGGRIRDAVVGAFNTMADWAGIAWGRLRDLANAPIRWVIDVVYNGGIVPLWNKVVDIFGGPRAVPLAGGGVLPGYSPGNDTIPAMLSPGEAVLTPEAVKIVGARNILELNRQASGRPAGSRGHYAGGGIIGSIADWISDPIGHIKSLFSGVVGDGARTPGIGQLRDAMVSLPGKVLDLAISKVKDLVKTVGSFFSAAFTGSGNVMGWIMEAIHLTGTPDNWAGPLSVLINRESGGNPNAINLTDSNAQAGHPSQGLMQTIPSTFTAYHQAGTSWNITDPIANIAAGINYIKARYGTVFNVQQANPNLPPRGYDLGGLLQPGAQWVANYTGKPERILSARQTDAFERFIQMLHHWNMWERNRPGDVNVAARSGGGGPVGAEYDQYGNRNLGGVTVNVVQQAGSPAETGRFVSLALRGVG